MIFHDPEGFLAEVEDIAHIAAEKILFRFRGLSPEDISEKSRNDHVTIADREAEDSILKAIGERFPDHAILAEESGRSGGLPEKPTWIVDPLDGTTNFVHGIAHFAVSIGVAFRGEILCGVILDPVKEDCFRFSKGMGVQWNGKPCVLSTRTGLPGSLLATGFPFKSHERLDDFLKIFRESFLRAKAIRRTGSAALDLAYTAAGIYDGFFEFGLAPWDLAAGIGMIREVGGVVIDMLGEIGEDPEKVIRTGDVLCGAPGLIRELRALIGELLEKEGNS